MKRIIIIILLLTAGLWSYGQRCEKAIAWADSIMKMPSKNLDEIEDAIQHYIFAENNCNDSRILETVATKKASAEKEKKDRRRAMELVMSKYGGAGSIREEVAANAEVQPVLLPVAAVTGLVFPAGYQGDKNAVTKEMLQADVRTLLNKLKSPGTAYVLTPDDQFVKYWEGRLYTGNYRVEDERIFDSTSREMAKGSAASENLLYVYLRASMYHIWNLLTEIKWDNTKLTNARLAIQEVVNRCAGNKFSSAKLNYALSGFENLVSRYYEKINDDVNSYRHALFTAEYARRAVDLHPASPQYNRSLYFYIKNLKYASDSLLTKNEKLIFASLRCEVASNMKNNLVKGYASFDSYLECLDDVIAQKLMTDDRNDRAQAAALTNDAIAQIKSYVAGVRSPDYGYLFSAQMYNRLVTIYFRYSRDSVAGKKALVLAEENMLLAMKASIFDQRLLEKLEGIFEDVSAIANDLYTDAEKTALAKKVIEVLETGENDYLNIKSLNSICSSSYLLLGNMHLRSKTIADTLNALTDFTHAIEVFENIDFLRYYSGYSEDFADFCTMYMEAVKMYCRQGNYPMAKRHYDYMLKKFGPIYKTYGWDFYLSQKLKAAAITYGEFLFQKKRYKESIAPLTFSSFEGIRQSTDYLVTIYSSDDYKDQALLDTFLARRNYQSNGMKRFTLNVLCDKTTQRFDVYIADKAKGHPYPAVQDQDVWLKTARGCIISPEAVTSFNSLQNMAWKNDVSFIDLCVYALEAASDSSSHKLTDLLSEAFETNRKNVKRLVAGRTQDMLFTYFKNYLNEGDKLRADSLIDEMVKVPEDLQVRYYLSVISYALVGDTRTKKLFLTDKNKFATTITYLTTKTLQDLTSNAHKWAHYYNLVSLDSAYYKIHPNDTLRKQMANSYNSLAWYSLLTKKWDNVSYYLDQSIRYDPTSLFPYSNQPHILLFKGQFEKAKQLYMSMKDKPFDATYPTYKQAFLSDFEEFEKEGLMTNDMKEIIRLLNEK